MMRIFIRMTRINLILIFLSVVAVDQISKYIIRHSGGFYICNPDVAFGINIAPILFWIIWAGIIVLLLFTLYRKTIIHPSADEAGNSLFIILILAGAISNLIDRLYFGCIIDFIDLRFLSHSELVWDWPVFNLADTFIVVGGIILILNIKHKKQKT
ncbi:lipoprotein signal peptidase [bacterium BMS3Abin15]|nr:lipoprotein signal peptidase [bacterium BMS3Abin15]HDH07541.1 signal peptidase II [Candidatus Moranbacteria bacterium]HDZ85003.1 signal peptidase II [Candidatus Moranbacteria bacterium]